MSTLKQIDVRMDGRFIIGCQVEKNKEKFDQMTSYDYSLVIDPSLFNLLEHI